jgi:hypothetical protein
LVRLSEDAVALAQTQAGGFSLDRSILDLREVVAESVKAQPRGRSHPLRIAGCARSGPLQSRAR